MEVIVLLLAAVGLAGFTGRAALERGRGAVLWTAMSVVAGVSGWVVGALLLGWSIKSDSVSFAAIAFSALGMFVGPLAAMFALLLVLIRLPERVPTISGERWPVFRSSTKQAPGFDCDLWVADSQLHLGDRVVIGAGEIQRIVADGEGIRISWAGESMLLLPRGKPRTPRERAKFSQGLERRLRTLLGLGT
jgi:hypothetical protein